MIYINFTPLGFLLFFLDVIILLVSINVYSVPVILMSSFIFSLFLWNLLELILQPLFLTLEIKTPKLVMEGTSENICVFIENKGNIPKSQIYVLLGKDKVFVGGLSRKEKKEISLMYNFEKRGVTSFNKLRVKFTGSLGLLYLYKKYGVNGISYVYPLYYPLSKDLYLIGEGGTKTSFSIPSVQGEEFHSLRDYQPQDPLKVIAWKASAKKGKLLSKSFEKLTRKEIYILIDNKIGKKDKVAEKEFDELLRFVHSIALLSFFLNTKLFIRALTDKEYINLKNIEDLRIYLAEMDLKENSKEDCSYDHNKVDLVFSLDYLFWDGKISHKNFIGVEFHEENIFSKNFMIYTLKEDPQEFLNRFLFITQA
uniref:DUF58 domain-containing protein n=1 Tax=Dictyoglomus thermophilum TaxID=14 RepID=A0A7C3RL72_DICTH